MRAGQRLPAPNHITQRKILASQAILLLQANDWTFLYDLEGQLQFPIEAAVTSLRPDVVLFSRSSKTIVLLELRVPLEDNVHLAHDRKTTKYSALVTACEENGFKTHMFALEVGCLGYCPHSFFHCFEALGLPKSAARQIRSEASKTALRSSYVLFLRRGICRLGSVKLFFAESCSRRDRSVFLSSFALPFLFRTVRAPRQLVPFPSIHTTPTRFSNSSTVRRRPYSHRTQWDVCIMAAHSNPRLLRGKSVAGRSERCRFPVFGKERTVSFALALGRFFSSKGCEIERVIFSSTWIKG